MADVPETRNGPGWVILSHPEIKDKAGDPIYVERTETAFNEVHKAKGWVKAEPRTKTTPKAGS